ncbi:MAG: LLM class flavin-dependent oxidoreductase [Candidatus Binatia bacterium]
MKVNVIQQVPYRHLPHDFENRYESVVTTPYALAEPALVHAAYREALDELMHAARMGFDGLAVTEHAQSCYDMAPNPDILAAAVAYATEVEGLKVGILPLGRSLGKAREPLRVAEEYAMIDCITNGRLLAGFPVGLAYDANINNGVAPVEQRARFEENLKLVTRAWTDPEPFAWNGKFHQHPIVNLWPRPIQQPPPIWMTGIGTPKSMVNAVDRGFGYNYFGWFGYKNLGPKVFSRFWKAVEQAGHEPNPYRVGFLQAIAVAETDAQAKELYAEATEYFFRKALGSIPIERMAMPGWIEPAGLEAIFRDPGDFGMFPMMKTITYDQAVEAGCLIAGGPKTVTEQLMAFLRECRVGNLHAMLQFGSMSHALARRNIELFANEVLPTLRQLWTNEWKHHWWPRALGGVPAQARAQQAAR